MTRIAVGLLGLVVVVPALAAREFVAEASHFECLTSWELVDTVRVFHPKPRKLRRATRKLAKIRDRGKRAKLPKGTVIQILPTEAMVKRGGGFNREGGGWEFFALGVSAAGTVILQRGGDEVANLFGSCQACHAGAGKARDFVCGASLTCAPIAFDPATILALQNADPRCQPAE